MIGKLKHFDSSRGFGFLSGGPNGDVFVHVSAFQQAGISTPTVGAQYDFDEAPGRNGRMQAVKIAQV